MSQISYQSEQAVVYDDVLPPDSFRRLFTHLNKLNYHSVHAQGWRKVWRLHDGNPLTSQAGWYYDQNSDTQKQQLLFPTKTPIDQLIQWIVERSPEVDQIVGKAGSAWKRFSFAPWIYPPGSGLSLHQDGVLYTGAFTYFAHPQWRLHWGGHLMVLDPKTEVRASAGNTVYPPFLTDDGGESVLNPGFAVTIFAKPNRLAFLSPACRHLLTRVDGNAGQNARVSVAGFFHKS
jgi:Rps23 Pro-64 3,4-dihydroxylase Tpa1-like proline 4-hydroxylase